MLLEPRGADGRAADRWSQTTVTGAGGAFRLAGPARAVRGRCGSRTGRPPTDPLLRCSRALRLRVPARDALVHRAARPARARSGCPAGCSAARCRRAGRSSSCRATRAGAGASSGTDAQPVERPVRRDLPVQGRVRGPRASGCGCGSGPMRAIRSRSATRGRSGSACDERRATCRRWTRWPRRSRRRARWPSPRRGRCSRSGASELLAGAADEVDLGARARAWARGGRAPLAAAGAERDRRDRAHEPRAGAAGGGGARGGRGGRGRLLEPRAGPVDRRARVAARARRGAAVRADRRGGGVRGQQRRGRGAAGGRGAGRAGPRGRRLARAAGRDRRRLPGAGRDRPGGRAAGRGGDDEPHAARRLPARVWARTRARCCACTSRTSASSGSSRTCRSRRCASSACR